MKNPIVSIIMGSDSFQNLPKWKNAELLLAEYKIYVYQRPKFEVDLSNYQSVFGVQAPHLDISATFIRNQIKAGKSIQYLVSDEVRDYIEANHYFK